MYNQNNLRSVSQYYQPEKLDHIKIVDQQVGEALPGNAKFLHLLGGIAIK
jgi:hypothetical protein